MNEVVADTHSILWYFHEPQHLSPAATAAMMGAALSRIYISAITLVELAYLVEKWRFPEAVLDHLAGVVGDPATGIVLAPPTHDVATAVRRVPRKLVPDMPDRIIAATALHLGLPLVTADSQIHSSGVPFIW